MDTQIFRNKTARTFGYLICLALIGIFVPKLLPGWLAQVIGGWINLTHWSPSSARKGGTAIVLLAVGYFRDAQNCIEIETKRLQAEQDAFYRFSKSMERITVTPSQHSPSHSLTLQPDPSENQLETIRNRYHETVMSVPHYEEDYDETLRENMSVEFNHDTATAVVDGVQCSPQLQQLLVTQARDAAQRRADVLEVVKKERDSITDAYRQLREVDTIQNSGKSLHQQSFAELVEYDEELRTSIEDCEQVLFERQQDLHQPTQHPSRTDQRFNQYLYEKLDVTFPILDAALNKIRDLKVRRQDVIQVLIRRK